MKAISDHGVFHSGGPNFAFDVSTRHIRDEEMEGIDLSKWRLAFNGAEPIRVSTMDAFVHRFKPFGFDQNPILQKRIYTIHLQFKKFLDQDFHSLKNWLCERALERINGFCTTLIVPDRFCS